MNDHPARDTRQPATPAASGELPANHDELMGLAERCGRHVGRLLTEHGQPLSLIEAARILIKDRYAEGRIRSFFGDGLCPDEMCAGLTAARALRAPEFIQLAAVNDHSPQTADGTITDLRYV